MGAAATAQAEHETPPQGPAEFAADTPAELEVKRARTGHRAARSWLLHCALGPLMSSAFRRNASNRTPFDKLRAHGGSSPSAPRALEGRVDPRASEVASIRERR